MAQRVKSSPPSGDYMHRYQGPWLLDPARTALIVVDMQHATGSRTAGLGRMQKASEAGGYLDDRFTRIENVVIPAIRNLLAAFRSRQLPIVYLVLGSARDDYSDMAPHLRAFTQAVGNKVGSAVHRILDEVRPEPGDTVLRKTTVGGFASTKLGELLRDRKVDRIVLCGISTSYCVDQTAREAADRGFHALIVEDAVAENEESWHRHSLQLFGRAFGRVADAATVLAEISANGQATTLVRASNRMDASSKH